MESSYVKQDPDAQQPATLEEDTYEDTADGELEIPTPMPEAWLARVPAFVHDQWAKIGDDEEIVLGHLNHYTQSGRVSLLVTCTKLMELC